MNARVRLGILGWGSAGQLMADAVDRSDRFELAGVADTSERAREQIGHDRNVDVHAGLQQLLAGTRPDVVYVATPTPGHAQAIAELAAAGVHAVCEKPLAAQWDDAVSAFHAVEEAGTMLLVGNTHSYDAPVQELRRLVVEGQLGTLVAVQTTAVTDWYSRPRQADDLSASLGGGIVLRQGAHQIDIVRLICGGLANTVSAHTFGGVDGTELGYSALIQFSSGTSAALQYSGAGGFDTAWLTQGVGELGQAGRVLDPVSRRYFRVPCNPEASAPTFGLTVATFTEGQAVLTSRGVLAYTANGAQEYDVDGRPSGWDAVLAELAAVLDGEAPTHSGLWGLATLEASLAVHQSARENRPVPLVHQVTLPAGR
jgi:phthalate 4,5-cis-dihydrodiol dehydrogenase